MRAGRLRESAVIQTLLESRDIYGEVIKTPQTFATVRAGLFPLRGRTDFEMHALNKEITHRIEIRYLPGITPDMRIVIDGRVFVQLAPPINIENQNKDLHLLCAERTGLTT